MQSLADVQFLGSRICVTTAGAEEDHNMWIAECNQEFESFCIAVAQQAACTQP
eukprot:m.281478 g.281478  ORF g.281478 m.281478 type:complete len:53 (-) comp19839_c0_seq10:505-663(-)